MGSLSRLANLAGRLARCNRGTCPCSRRVIATSFVAGTTGRVICGATWRNFAPRIFPFDEPLANLAAALRVQTRIEPAKLHRELGTTMIHVTHDQVEAMSPRQKTVVFNKGNIEQIGAPLDLYARLANLIVGGFPGSFQLVAVRVDGRAPKLEVGSPVGLALATPAITLFDAEDKAIAFTHDVQPAVEES